MHLALHYKVNPTASYQAVADGLNVPNKSTVYNDVKWLERNDFALTLTERSRAAIRASRLLRWCDQNLVNEEAKRVIRERDE